MAGLYTLLFLPTPSTCSPVAGVCDGHLAV
jgi:hypothetical protein